MYKIAIGDNAFYSDNVVFIRLAKNGSYVSSIETEADGVCVKIARDKVDETGKIYTCVTDEVYRISEDGLNKTEPLATVSKVEGKAYLTVNQERMAAFERIEGCCSATIYRGMTIDDTYYVFTDRAQADWAAALISVLDGATTVTVKVNDVWMDYTAAQVRTIYNKMREFIYVARWYNEELVTWIQSETDGSILHAINFGSKLPDTYMQKLSSRCSAKSINLADYAGLLK